MRIPAAVALLAASCFSVAQTSGSYAGSTWSVTPQRGLDWGGTPYLPVGYRIPASANALAKAQTAGVKDLILDATMGTDLKAIVGAAEAAGMRYIISMAEAAPLSPAFVVNPAGYRIDKVDARADLRIPIQDARSIFYLILNPNDYSIASKGWADVVDGSARLTLSLPASNSGYVALLYPRLVKSNLPDYWEQLDYRRDLLLAKLAGAGFGKGLRGVLNPFGDAKSWTSSESDIVPDSAMFRLEFEAFLQQKYKSVPQLEIAWKLTRRNLDNFATAARLVPLFGDTRGVEAFFDPESSDILYASRYQNAFWTDVRTVVGTAALRRTGRIAKAVRQIADVPVIYEWKDWSGVQYRETPSGDGIGMIAKGVAMDPLERFAAPTAASALAWNTRRWLVATDLSGPFENEQQLRDVVSQTLGLGAKGWFVRWRNGSEAPWIAKLNSEASQSPATATEVPRAVFYPLNARYPANTMMLPGGVWWLPVPVAGDRLDLGPDYEGYRMKSPFADFTALWRTTAPAKVKLRFTNPTVVSIRNYDGTPVEAKIVKEGIELTIDTLPIIISGTEEIPAPIDAIDMLRADFRALEKEALAKRINTGSTQFAFDDAFRGMERSPGAAFAKMMEVFNELTLKVAPYSWIEGESSFETNFGEVSGDPAASNKRVISLNTALKPPAGGYFAKYRFQSLPEIEVAEVWISAFVPDAVRSLVKISVGDVTLAPLADPQYSGGDYAWYNLGKLTLRNGQYVLTVVVPEGAPEYRMRIDSILVTPLPFRPTGPRIPRYMPIVR
ncbi:MAG: hypothetical protein M3R13_01330 [Armatimonadota bacterium]|nr:hypothetical protein [Armatimonadota bacterium]